MPLTCDCPAPLVVVTPTLQTDGMSEKQPTSLFEAMRYFSDPERCTEFVKNLRWPDGAVTCTHCGVGDPMWLATRKVWKCRKCRKQFSLKSGTIFEKSSVPLDKWLIAIWLICNSKNGISSCELGRALAVTQKTAWFMNHRIRLAMDSGSYEKLDGVIEIDETYVGGLAKNMHKKVRTQKITGTGGVDKIAIQGARERGGEFRAAVITGTSAAEMQANVFGWVKVGATVYTDQAPGYRGIDTAFAHKTVNHGVEYVSGDVHINGTENFWCLFKRAHRGTYTHMHPEHAHRYLAERVFSFNGRDLGDLGRMQSVVSAVAGKRVTYTDLKVNGR